MKCYIDGKEVNAKVTENLGFQGGNYAKAVEYQGEEHIVVKKGDKWMNRTVAERLGIR
jgi:hypothetical protein